MTKVKSPARHASSTHKKVSEANTLGLARYRTGPDFLDRVLIRGRPWSAACGFDSIKSIAYDVRSDPEFLIGF